MDKFFAVFGKLILGLFAAVVLIGGGYFLAKNSGVVLQKSNFPIQTEATPEASSPAISTKTITAGLPSSSKLSFTVYTVTLPQDWSVSEQKDQSLPSDKLILSKGNYSIYIYQAATGGAQCIYPGDPSPEGPSVLFSSFVEFSGSDQVIYRRGLVNSTNIPTQNFAVCAKTQPNYGFGQPTSFGHVLYTAPKAFDQTVLSQMDSIIASLTKVQP